MWDEHESNDTVLRDRGNGQAPDNLRFTCQSTGTIITACQQLKLLVHKGPGRLELRQHDLHNTGSGS